MTESFEYDYLNRLEKITLNGTESIMGYDEYGRITSKQAQGEDVFSDAVYEDWKKPHAIRQATVTANPFDGRSQTIQYTMFDKVASIRVQEKQTLSYLYGYDHQRIKLTEIDFTEPMITCAKTYVGNCEFWNGNVFGPAKSLTYLSGPMGVFAVVEKNSEGESLHYIYKDHLGSWTTITDAEGNIEQEASFDAWGNIRSASDWTSPMSEKLLFDRGYTGHEHLYFYGRCYHPNAPHTDLSLINMNGRMYDPVMSSFLSVDNYVQSPDNSQNFNRYAYCLNNPLKYTDPSGEFVITTGVIIAAAAIIGAGIGTYQGYKTAVSQGLTSWDMAEKMVLGGLIGAASGAASAGVGVAVGGAVAAAEIGGFGGGCITGGASGFVGGAINGYGMSRFVEGKSFGQSFTTSITSGLVGMGTGALLGGVSSGIASSVNGKSFWNGKSLPMPRPAVEPLPELTPKPAHPITSNERQILNRIVPDEGNVSYKYEYLQKITGNDIQHTWNRHSIEIVVDNGQAFECIGGDGKTYVFIQQLGNHNGNAGVFEMMFDMQNEVVTHQRFIPGGIISGNPNQITQQQMSIDYFKWW